ncbi:hypothetical protein KSF_089710 [Reticulibacter mediterranei]|uniref:Uncharacterized protein n=1 Tax=Reticulibacter mediterranei TaxID=2778369 RepID=A0A8J3IUT0_9CHLR|nr:DUF6585 family protein [Reticulibacter mediterranei]GHO98923.1 hypothetical protein KSF_089710 [Reticulibacter mediterranei]
MQQQTTRQVDADMLAHKHKLGSLRTAYDLAHASFCRHIFAIAFASLFFLPFFLLLPTIQSAQLKMDISSFLLLLFALLFPGAGLFMIIRIVVGWINVYHRRNSSLLLYTYGLLFLQYQKQQLVASDVLHWQNVALIWHEVHQKSGPEETGAIIDIYKIQNKQGALFGGNSFKFNMKKLGKIVEQETLPYLWPSTVDSYQRGHLVTFGTISLSLDGIHYAGQLLPWQAVKEVRCNWVITIKQQSDGMLSSWARVSDKDVPNIHLLYALLDFIRNQQGPVAFFLEKKR